MLGGPQWQLRWIGSNGEWFYCLVVAVVSTIAERRISAL
jgi:hypothetical protein